MPHQLLEPDDQCLTFAGWEASQSATERRRLEHRVRCDAATSLRSQDDRESPLVSRVATTVDEAPMLEILDEHGGAAHRQRQVPSQSVERDAALSRDVMQEPALVLRMVVLNVLRPLQEPSLSTHRPAGYSGTPLPRKLGLKAGHRAALVAAPQGIEGLFEPQPEDVSWVGARGRELDLIVFFVRERGELERRFDSLAGRLVPNGMLWIAWPKQASAIAADLKEGDVREVGLAHGFVDTKVCAISDTWSGLRFVRRLRDR